MRGLFGKVFDKNLGVSKKENNEMDYEYRRMDRTIKNTGHKGKYCLQIQKSKHQKLILEFGRKY